MEVPFIASGAMSRHHYALVRKVESANSAQLADQYLLTEVNTIRHNFSRPGLSLKKCKEYLVILLYCSMTLSSGVLANGQFVFALRYAINLAEAGENVKDKRIGYSFCADLMPPNHELQLMLINTLRKDLESTSLSRICLALDTLILAPTEDVVPAVQSRLHDLLMHNSPHVRRRALLAFRSLSRHDPDLLSSITTKVQKRLTDPGHMVASAALIVSTDIAKLSTASPNEINLIVNDILALNWSSYKEKSKQWLLSKVLSTLRSVKISNENTRVITQIIRFASSSRSHALLYEAFLLLSNSSSESLSSLQGGRHSPVHSIRYLLVSKDPNERYLFLSCLECLDPDLWAGTKPDTAAVLEAWEVEQVMQFLDSSDSLIRKKTLGILYRIDPDMVKSYYSRSLQGMSPTLPVVALNEYMARLLEVVVILTADDGEAYASQIQHLFMDLEDKSHNETRFVLDGAIETILLFIRRARESFRIACATTLITFIVEQDTSFGQTMMVIVSALACEYSGKLSVAPVDILRGLAIRLSLFPPTIQDACLLSMLRIVADCAEVSSEVLNLVSQLGQNAGRYVRRRCDQFSTLCRQKNVLANIVSKARSASLPDFLESLNAHQSMLSPSDRASSPTPSRSTNSSSPHLASLSGSKLRYAAYDAPRPIPRIRRPSISKRTTSSTSSSRSASFSEHGYEREGRQSLFELSRTVTAGDLALAAGDIELDSFPKSSTKPILQHVANVEDLASRVDLMTFDSPFIADPTESPPLAGPGNEPDFETTWNIKETSRARGWCEASTNVILQRLQQVPELHLKLTAADGPPFKGDLKVLIATEASAQAALRLGESEDGSCLWQLRCNDDDLRTRIKHMLVEA